ncbi:class I SAM-dependent methyltransferase [Thiohalomonas denitrificans]|uniref:Methyltransferase domain-containing protein n=1 Tax=Thiohalomonas denitrificans TaxID=415747 RepID=A0A1G5QRR5_9GAMM|nr:methyltransferase domain-containing protein [Thiohalomonas denitrificans]SCZ64457.1 Methyltransferase domain-containing protein [Thiohalomonas denitrificans]
MPDDPRAKWDARYRDADAAEAAPARVLMDFAHLLPERGEALDVACGLGGNARFLAQKGLQVTAWDISAVAIQRLRAATDGLALQAGVRDLVREPPPANRFDVIVVSRYLERSLAPHLTAALKPGGLLFYQTYTRERVSEAGPGRDAFRLAPNELLALFPDLRVVAYREEGRLGRLDRGFRDEAMLVAVKPLGACRT